MGKKLIFGAVVGMFAISYGCSSGAGTTAYSLEDFEFPLESTNVANGTEVYAEFCEGCHPGGEEGDGPKISDAALSPAKVRWQVRVGGKDMPAFGADKISDANLEDLLAYTATLGTVLR